MTHITLIRRPDGSSVQIVVRAWTAQFRREGVVYDVTIQGRPKGAKKWGEGKATPAEIHEAKLKCWNKMKPTP